AFVRIGRETLSLPSQTRRRNDDIHRECRARHFLTMGAVANCRSQWFGIALVAYRAAKAATRDFWHRFPPAICEREQAALIRCRAARAKYASDGLFDLSEQHNCVARLVKFVVFFNLMKDDPRLPCRRGEGLGMRVSVMVRQRKSPAPDPTARSQMDFRFRWKSGRAVDITAMTEFDPEQRWRGSRRASTSVLVDTRDYSRACFFNQPECWRMQPPGVPSRPWHERTW